MRRIEKLLVSIALSLSLLSCGGAKSPGPGGGGEGGGAGGDQAEPRGKVSGETPKPPVETPDAPDTDSGSEGSDDECVKTCIDANMARAVAAEIIRKDCEAECSDTQSPKE